MIHHIIFSFDIYQITLYHTKKTNSIDIKLYFSKPFGVTAGFTKLFARSSFVEGFENFKSSFAIYYFIKIFFINIAKCHNTVGIKTAGDNRTIAKNSDLVAYCVAEGNILFLCLFVGPGEKLAKFEKYGHLAFRGIKKLISRAAFKPLVGEKGMKLFY